MGDAGKMLREGFQPLPLPTLPSFSNFNSFAAAVPHPPCKLPLNLTMTDQPLY